MSERRIVERQVRELLESQLLAVLSTLTGGAPYANLIAFTASDDLAHLIFATARATRKYANLSAAPEVALLIDNRSNSEADFHQAAAVTALGRAEEVTGPDCSAAASLHLARHPYLHDFLKAPSTALFRITVRRYILVTHFQKVMQLHMRDEVDQPPG